MPTQAHEGLSIVEQYAKRRQHARDSWSLHMLVALVPFGVFLVGPRSLAIPAWIGFAVCLIHGAVRKIRIDRCPACNASRWNWYASGWGIRGYHSTLPYCESCRVQLIAD
jgi:hypothetical protein